MRMLEFPAFEALTDNHQSGIIIIIIIIIKEQTSIMPNFISTDFQNTSVCALIPH
jgi:hypothetical protein